MASPTIAAVATESGRCVRLDLSSPLTAISDGSDVQVLSIAAGSTPAAPLKLTLAGHQTDAIGSAGTSPATSFVRTKPVPNDYIGTLDVGFSFAYANTFARSTATPTMTIRLKDGAGVQQGPDIVLDLTKLPAEVSGSYAVPGHGTFLPLGTFDSHAAAGKGPTIIAEMSGPDGGKRITSGALRIAPQGTAPGGAGEAIYNGRDGDHLPDDASWSFEYGSATDGSNFEVYSALGQGTSSVQYPTAAAIQSALEALPNVGAGNVSVSQAGPTGPWPVAFVGDLRGLHVDTLVPSDAAYSVLHDGTGGSYVGGSGCVVTVGGVDYPIAHDRIASLAGRKTIVLPLPDPVSPAPVPYGGPGFANIGTEDEGAPAPGARTVGYRSSAGLAASYYLGPFTPGIAYDLQYSWPAVSNGLATAAWRATDASGAVVGSGTIDQSSASAGNGDFVTLAGYTAASVLDDVSLTISVPSAVAGKSAVLGVARAVPRASSPPAIVGGSSATVSAPSGYFATADGPLMAFDHAPVAAPAPRYPALPTRAGRTMAIGVNMTGDSYYDPGDFFANIATRIDLNGPNNGYGVFARDALGNPTRIAPRSAPSAPGDPNDRGEITFILFDPNTAPAGDNLGFFQDGNGDFVVEWHAASAPIADVGLRAKAATCVVTEDPSRRVGGPGINRRAYHVVDLTRRSPTLMLVISSATPHPDGGYRCDVTGLVVTGPGVDHAAVVADPAMIHPGLVRDFSAATSGVAGGRWMDRLNINNATAAIPAHFRSLDQLPLGYGQADYYLPVASLDVPDNTPYSTTCNSGIVVRVNLSADLPAGFVTGWNCTLSIPGATIPVAGLVTAADGSTTSDPGRARQIDSLVPSHAEVIDQRTVLLSLRFNDGGPDARLDRTIAPPAGTALHFTIGAPDPAEIGLAAAALGIVAWANLPTLADADCIRWMAGRIASTYPAGRQIRVEPSNEIWNSFFPVFSHFRGLSQRLPGIPRNYNGVIPAAARFAKMGFDAFVDGWVAAGRPASEVVRVLGGFQADGNYARTLLDEFASVGGSCDEICVGTYFNNDGLSCPDVLGYSLAQHRDLLAINLLGNITFTQAAGNKAALAGFAAANPSLAWAQSLRLVSYEGGAGTLVPASMSYINGLHAPNAAANAHALTLNGALLRAPEFYAGMLNFYDKMDGAGVSYLGYYKAYSRDALDGWIWHQDFAGLMGDGTAAQVPDPYSLAAPRSQVAGASKAWSVLAGYGTSTPAPTPVTVTVSLGAISGGVVPCTAVVTGSTRGVTWSATLGTIAPSGLTAALTPPAATSAAQPVTVTATSVEDPGVSASATYVVASSMLPVARTLTDADVAAIWAYAQRTMTAFPFAVSLSPSGLDSVQVEPGINARQALAPILASAAGKVTGVGAATGTGEAVVLSPAGVARITILMDGDQRAATTLHLPT